ncbi:MAG: nitrous oxide reductase accessory protein NosL [Rhodocyclales bacterium]|nr:nitrous oxide reductase accessory protein NosL [Rhodocyclales bacterium]
MFVPPGTYSTAGSGTGDDYCIVAPAIPHDPASGIPPLAPKPVPRDARCPVCGMYPARFERWAAQIIYTDGASHFFDSPVNLHVFLADMSRYTTAYTEADIRASYVTDLSSGSWLQASAAWYVLGSNALGPMRDGNLPAFATRESALAFAQEQGGKVIVADDVTLDSLRTPIPSARHHQHPR